MSLYSVKKLLLTFAVTTVFSFSAVAQQAPPIAPEQQITQRIANFQATVDKASNDGKLNAKQVASDKKRISVIQGQLNKALAKNKGHLSKNAQSRLNRTLDKDELKERAQENKPSKPHGNQHGNLMKTPHA